MPPSTNVCVPRFRFATADCIKEAPRSSRNVLRITSIERELKRNLDSPVRKFPLWSSHLNCSARRLWICGVNRFNKCNSAATYLPTKFQPLRWPALRILEFSCRLFTAFHMPKMGNRNALNWFIILDLQASYHERTIEIFCALSRYFLMLPTSFATWDHSPKSS
jgi:hypothetical protein